MYNMWRIRIKFILYGDGDSRVSFQKKGASSKPYRRGAFLY